MSYLKGEIGYLEGLAEGLNFDESKPEHKLILRLIDTLDMMADEIEELEDNIEDLNRYIVDLEMDRIGHCDCEDDFYYDDLDDYYDDEEYYDYCCCDIENHKHDESCCGGKEIHGQIENECGCGCHEN